VPHGSPLYNYRIGGYSLSPALTYTTSARGSITPVYSYTGVALPSIHSYSQTKGGIVINAPQRFSPSTPIKSLAVHRPTAFYRAPSSSNVRTRHWTGWRGSSANGKKVDNGWRGSSTNGKKVDNGWGGSSTNGKKVDNGWRGNSANDKKVDIGWTKIQIVPSEDKVDNGYKKINYEIIANPSLPNQKAAMSDLRSRAEVARGQLSQHKVMLDRYLPVSLDKPNDVDDEIANKYGELLIRMPQLEYRHRTNKSLLEEEPAHRLIIAPYTPAMTTHHKIDKLAGLDLPPVRNSFTPKISDTRKHARRVLCKIHGDPKYFDYS